MLSEPPDTCPFVQAGEARTSGGGRGAVAVNWLSPTYSITNSYLMLISKFLPSPVSIIFLNVLSSTSDLSFSMREIYVLEVPLISANSCCVNPKDILDSLINRPIFNANSD